MKFATLLLFTMTAGSQTADHKYYITGYADFSTGGDCTNPALISYGKSRVDALLRVSAPINPSHVTVWTEAEYRDMRKNVGALMDAGCMERYGKPTPTPVAPPVAERPSHD